MVEKECEMVPAGWSEAEGLFIDGTHPKKEKEKKRKEEKKKMKRKK